jgi:hypothetical protein
MGSNHRVVELDAAEVARVAPLREQGVRYWSVAVVEPNDDATRLYERVGFRSFYRQLLAEV